MAEQQQQEGSVHPPPDNPSQSQEHLHEQDGAPNTNKIDHSPRLENRSAQSSLQPMRSTKSRRRSLSRGCLDLTKVTVGVLHMIWFDLFFLLVVLGIAGAVYKWAPIWRGEGRYFPVFYDPATNSWSGPTYLSYPTAYEENKNLTFNPLPAMVPKFTVPVIKFSVALPVSVGFALLLMQIWVRSAWDKLAALAGLYKGLALTTLIQVSFKKFIGEFRPNFIQNCRPDWDTIAKSESITRVSNQVWAQTKNCKAWKSTGWSKNLVFVMESFPSGHTSESFAAATFLVLYLNAKLKPFSDYHTSLWKIVIVLSPLVAASVVAGTVVIENNHHIHDAVLSAPIGIVISMLTYRAHYASLFDYRTNHLYLPWSSSHQSLAPQPQASLTNLSSKPSSSRFRHYNNLTAVAWPRRHAPMFGEIPGKDQNAKKNDRQETFDGTTDNLDGRPADLYRAPGRTPSDMV